MLNELKQLWKETDTIQKIMMVVFLPIGIVVGIIYGLWLIFWNVYGITFICGMVLLQSTDTPEEGWQRGQAVGTLVGLILLIIRAVKSNNKKEN
jgi:hypothetical protein